MARSAQLTIYGYTTDTTSYAGNKAIITNGISAATAGSNDASGTLRVAATNFKLYNVNVINSCEFAFAPLFVPCRPGKRHIQHS